MRPVSRLSIRSISVLQLCFLGLVLSAAGCAGTAPGERSLLLSGVPITPSGPDVTHDSVEGAAISALTIATTRMTQRQSRRIQVGSIVEVDGGYRWVETQDTRRASASSWRPSARAVVLPNQVASYVIHPRTGDRRIDRIHEDFTPSERAWVDQRDPKHRPLFLLTPSGRLVSYEYGQAERTGVEVAKLRHGRSTQRALAATDLGAASAEKEASRVHWIAGAR